jgi:hypothetical protein
MRICSSEDTKDMYVLPGQNSAKTTRASSRAAGVVVRVLVQRPLASPRKKFGRATSQERTDPSWARGVPCAGRGAVRADQPVVRPQPRLGLQGRADHHRRAAGRRRRCALGCVQVEDGRPRRGRRRGCALPPRGTAPRLACAPRRQPATRTTTAFFSGSAGKPGCASS